MFDTITHPQRRAFLSAFAELANVSRAAKLAKCSREAHYDWLRDPDYQAAFREARSMACIALEDEAVRRARFGTLKPVFQGGGKVGVIRVYSDTLLATLLAAWMPEKYRKNVAHSGPDGGAIAHTHKPDLSGFTVEELKLLERLADKASTPRPRPAREPGVDPRGAAPEGETEDR
jgi:hypothetical protein